MKQSLAKNTTFLTAAYIIQKLFSFIYFTLIARWIGPEDIGKFIFAISLATLLAVFIDLGLTNVLIRESAKFKDKANSYLNNLIAIKAVLTFVIIGIGVYLIYVLDKGLVINLMILFALGAMAMDQFTHSFWGIFRGFQNIRYESYGVIITQIVIFAIGLTGIYMGLPLYILAVALVGGSLANFTYSLYLILFKLKFKLHFEYDRALLKPLFIIAIPFALAAIFTRVYNSIDQILLSTMVGDRELGYYSIAYKITFALQFIPAAFVAGLYPTMSDYFHTAKEKLAGVYEKSVFFLMLLATPLIVGTIVLADKFIPALYTSQFDPSILTLQILILSVFASFINFPVGTLLNACDRQKTNTINMGLTMLLNIILNVILIPKYQHIGAALASVISLSLLLTLNLFAVPKIIKVNVRYIAKKTILIFFSAAVMGVTVWTVKEDVSIIISIIIGVLVFPAVLYISRGITKNEVKTLTQSVFKKEL